MNLFERLAGWLGLEPVQDAVKLDSGLHDTVEQSRHARRTEQYAEALRLLDEAAEQTRLANNTLVSSVLDLQRAELLLLLERYDDASALVDQIEQISRAEGQMAQTAYALSVRGKLAIKQGDVEGARTIFERALATAKSVRAIGAAGRAGGYLAELYLAEGNASYAEHLLREALPRIDGSGDVEMKCYFTGRMGEVYLALGQTNDGVRLLQHALKLAERLQHLPYTRLWRLALGRQAVAEHRFEDAFYHYQHGLNLYPDPPVSRTEYIDALWGLSYAALKLHRIEQAIVQARKAVDLAIHGDERTARTQGLLGMALRANRQYEEALPHIEAAAQFYEQLDSRSQPDFYVDVLRSLAITRGETVGTGEAITTYKHAIEVAKQRDLHLQLAQVYRDLGLYYRKLHRHGDALTVWSQALPLFELDNRYAQVARLYCDMGAVRDALGQGKRAIKDYEHALMALNSVDDERTRGIVLSNVANAFVEQGDIETTEGFFAEAIQIAHRLEDQIAEATRRGNYAWFLLITGRLQRAQAALQLAQHRSEKLGLTLQAAIHYDNLGSLHAVRGDYAEALRHHEGALQRIEALGNAEWQHTFSLNKADVLIRLGQLDAASTIYDVALEYGRSINHFTLIVRALIGQSRVAILQNRLENAQQLSAEAETIAQSADFRRLLGDVLVVHSELEFSCQQPEQAETTWYEAQDILRQIHALDFSRHPDWTKQSAN